MRGGANPEVRLVLPHSASGVRRRRRGGWVVVVQSCPVLAAARNVQYPLISLLPASLSRRNYKEHPETQRNRITIESETPVLLAELKY